MPSSQTNYAGGTVRSVNQREGIDIGERPDFFADLAKIKALLKPQQRQMPMPQAGAQAQYLRAPQRSEPTGERPTAAAPQEDDYEPIFGVQGIGGNMIPYIPGVTPLPLGQQPVAMGYRRKSWTSKAPASAQFVGAAGPSRASAGSEGGGSDLSLSDQRIAEARRLASLSPDASSKGGNYF